MSFKKTTESDSLHDNLQEKSTYELLVGINHEDQKVAYAVKDCIVQIEPFVDQLVERFTLGGRLFYIGAGTSGRLGVVDASEIPPTFGLDHGQVIGLIAGGDGAIRKAVEFAEDDCDQAWTTLKSYQTTALDTVVGIAASGTTPYVIGGVRKAKENGLLTACITNNKNSTLANSVDYPIEAEVGPEFVTGSTRMKSGTAQKLILNMISTALMIRLGHVVGNRMVDMKLTNDKLWERGINYLVESLHVSIAEAKALLVKHKSVREALKAYSKG
jgi:N-acetylmuramic acid 6-phosphate etherase